LLALYNCENIRNEIFRKDTKFFQIIEKKLEHIRAFTHSAWLHMSETACGRFAGLQCAKDWSKRI
jgi:hypothetical protein